MISNFFISLKWALNKNKTSDVKSTQRNFSRRKKFKWTTFTETKKTKNEIQINIYPFLKLNLKMYQVSNYKKQLVSLRFWLDLKFSIEVSAE